MARCDETAAAIHRLELAAPLVFLIRSLAPRERVGIPVKLTSGEGVGRRWNGLTGLPSGNLIELRYGNQLSQPSLADPAHLCGSSCGSG
jgi:hypothetical protein